MNLGFYGHSYARSVYPFTKILADKINAKIVNYGTIQGSEERILRDIKRSKNLDIAIIFHSYPVYVYLPHSDRDFNVQNSIENRSDYLWKNRSHLEQIDSNWDREILKHPKFYQSFKTKDNFQSAMKVFKEHFYDYDLFNSRFIGALIQIDRYLQFKGIAAVHVVDQKKNYIPNWFHFESGIVDFDICNRWLINTDPSSVSYEDNLSIADHLYNLLDAARSREAHTPDDQSGDGGSIPPAAPIYES